MKIFLDSAKMDEIEKAYASGIVDGITTNPSLMKAAIEGKKTDLNQYIQKILTVAGKTPVSLEVKGGSSEEMYAQAKAIYRRFSNPNNRVVIKIPMNPATGEEKGSFEGLKAIKRLSDEKIPVNVTLVFTPEQALLAAKAGAAYVSPFAGRIDDMLRKEAGMQFGKSDYFPADGMAKGEAMAEDNGIFSGIYLVAQIVDIFQKHNIRTEVLAASLRNARQVREAALVGAQVATVPYAVLEAMTDHKLTKEGMRNFLKDTVSEYEALMK